MSRCLGALRQRQLDLCSTDNKMENTEGGSEQVQVSSSRLEESRVDEMCDSKISVAK